jgi:hypothetical protein
MIKPNKAKYFHMKTLTLTLFLALICGFGFGLISNKNVNRVPNKYELRKK